MIILSGKSLIKYKEFKMKNDFERYLSETGEFGVIEKLNPPMAVASGLPNVQLNELVVLENGEIGQVFAIHTSFVEILLFSHSTVPMKTRVTRTSLKTHIPVGKELTGHIISPLGDNVLDERVFKRPSTISDIYKSPPPLTKRSRITKPLFTGTTLVDSLLPLAKGQRQLILGDRKTGKTSFMLQLAKYQIQMGSVIVYAAIGKKKSEIKRIFSYFEENNLLGNVVMVATAADSPASLIHMTPYSAMTIAEYFCELGNDVVIIFDDLTTHARFYRELSLVGRKFPGRESYPGDTFFMHARLLERAGNFKAENGEFSITAFPMAETIESDLTGYIVSNLVSITDGHLLFDATILNEGRLPAIDLFLSVTRVGKQTRNQLQRDLASRLLALLANYERINNLSRFETEITLTTKQSLRIGDFIYQAFNQSTHAALPYELQIVLLLMAMADIFDPSQSGNFSTFCSNFINCYTKSDSAKQLVMEINNSSTFDQAIEKVKLKREELRKLCVINGQ